MDDQLEVEPAVSHLWDCVKVALEANKNPDDGQWPSPVRIAQLAVELDLELAASTVDEWFKKWSFVPLKWEKFENILKVLGAEKDQNWKALYASACRHSAGVHRGIMRLRRVIIGGFARPTEPFPWSFCCVLDADCSQQGSDYCSLHPERSKGRRCSRGLDTLRALAECVPRRVPLRKEKFS